MGLIVPLMVYQVCFWIAFLFSRFHSSATGQAVSIYDQSLAPPAAVLKQSPAAGFVTDPFANAPASTATMASDSEPGSDNQSKQSEDKDQEGDQ